MARFDGGWIKIWRKTADSDLVDNAYLWALWHWLLISATWKTSKILWNGKQREIPPGTIVFSLKELSDKWGCSRSVMSKWLKYLHDTKRIVYEASTRGCIATIYNWELYQSIETQEIPDRARDVNAASTRRVHGETLSEEGKKERREEVRKKSYGGLSESTPSSEVWESYRSAYRGRHGADPTRNATINSQITNFLKRVPAGEAAEIAKFYVSHNDQFYVRSLHPVGLMLKDAEKLRTEWLTGRRMTGSQARMAEKGSHAQDQLARIARGEL